MISIYYLTSLGLVIFGIFIFLFFIWKSRRLSKLKELEQPKAIKHYEKIRDKLTLREEEIESDETSLGTDKIPKVIISIITLALVIYVSFTIFTEINNSLNTDSQVYNVSSSLTSVLVSASSFIPMFMLITAICIILAITLKFFSIIIFPGEI